MSVPNASSTPSFGDQLRARARAKPDATAVVFEGESFSFEELYERSVRLANSLIGLGIRPGDRVATLAPNRAESVEEICAIELAGAVRVPLYTHNAVPSHLHMLQVTRAKALIVAAELWAEIEPYRREAPDLSAVIVHDAIGHEQDYGTMIDGASSVDPGIVTVSSSVHNIRFSSGTTGKPKGIMFRQGPYYLLGTAFADVMGIREGSVQIVAGPMSHIAGATLWPMIERGATHVIMPRFNAERFIDHIEGDRGSLALIVPTMLRSILDVAGLENRDLSAMTALGYGGAPIDETTLRRALDVFGPVFVQTYGQSEVSPIGYLPARFHDPTAPEFDPELLRSAGFPVPGARIRIVDEGGHDVPAGEVGEIAVHAPWHMSEIWQDPDATLARFLPDGSLLTGDMGGMRKGAIFMADRKDDLIISGGFNIWPTEVENALLSHPDVADAAVIGLPHDRWGQTVVAVVVPVGDSLSSDEVIDWCRTQVGGVKKPTRVILRRDPLPRSGTGKLLRRQVREDYIAGDEL